MIDWLVGAAQAFLKWLWQIVIALVVVFVATVIAESIKPLRDLDTYLNEHTFLSTTLKVITVGMVAIGWALLVFSQFLPAPKWHGGAQTPSPPIAFREKSTQTNRRFSRRFDRSFEGEASFSNVKRAWRSRSWRYSREWRLLFLMGLGALLLTVGLFGFFVVIGPPTVKLICGGALIYALVRTVYAFSQA
jgi:hypothetical protein